MRILVAVADVDATVKKGSAIDDHARDQHDVRVHGGAGLPDAAREALDRPHLARRGPAAPGGGHRDGGRRGRRGRRVRRVSGYRAEPREARLQQRGRLARRQRAAAAEARGRARARCADTASGSHGAGDEESPAPAGRAEPRDDPDPGHLQRRRPGRPPARREEPGQGAHRGLHDRGKRGDREVSRGQGLSVVAAHLADARALGSHRRARGDARRAPARRAERRRAREHSSSSVSAPMRRDFPIWRSPS